MGKSNKTHIVKKYIITKQLSIFDNIYTIFYLIDQWIKIYFQYRNSAFKIFFNAWNRYKKKKSKFSKLV